LIFSDTEKINFRQDFIGQGGKLIQPFESLKRKVYDQFNESSELFAKHFKKNYQQPYPIWALVEVISFGTLSFLYKDLRHKKIKTDIAKIYNIQSSRVFEIALHHLSVVRNISAHHGRLWNRNIDKPFEIPLNLEKSSALNSKSRRIYNSYILIKHLITAFDSSNKDLLALESFFQEHRGFAEEYGFIK
jgi:abortive infection bacteriophage resistance protein